MRPAKIKELHLVGGSKSGLEGLIAKVGSEREKSKKYECHKEIVAR